jgi:nucleoredoxin
MASLLPLPLAIALIHCATPGAIALENTNSQPTEVKRGEAPKAKDNYWVKTLSDKLLPNNPHKLDSGKITALYMSSYGCSPCREFTPELIKFRDRYKDKFQFVFISYDHTLDQQLKYMNEDKINATAVPFDSTHKKEITKNRLGDAIPQLLVYSADGSLLTRNGRAIIESHRTKDDDQKNGSDLLIWNEILKDWNQLKINEIEKMLSEKKSKYGENIFWPYYVSAMKSFSEVWNYDKSEMENLGNIIGKSKDWSSLNEIIDMSTGKTELHFCAEHILSAAGLAGSDDPNLRKIMSDTPKDDLRKMSSMLIVFSEATAKTKSSEDQKIFWSCYESIPPMWAHRSLRPLLRVGDQKAFKIVEDGLKNTTMQYVYASILEDVIASGPNSRASKMLEEFKARQQP